MDANETLGPYLLIEQLGRGGFSEVWRARPQPERLADNPTELLPFLEVLQGLLETREDQAPVARLIKNLRENLHVLQRLGQRPDEDLQPPSELQAAHDAAAESLGAWLADLAATGALDLALKVPFHDGYVRQLRREEDVLSRVSHPNLVRQLTLDAAHEPPYLAMELVEGWSLRDALRQEATPPLAKVLSVMDQLLGVLDHLHKRGLIHGDVKPENILLEPDGTLRLIDLGLGRVSQQVMRDAYLSVSLASRVPVMGTLSYMAPEVRQGHEAGALSDLYSAGIVLYEMLVGDVPSGMSLPSLAAPERELSTRYDVLLKWVLHPEPQRRIPSAGEFRERVLLTLNPRDRHQLGRGRSGQAREGTFDFDQWALEQASPFVAGDWIGDYNLEEPLGRGGFGEVWRAKPAGGGPVALKIAIGPHGREGLVKEAEFARRLSHEQIPAYVAEDLDHDPPYLVVGYVRGESLRARLNAEGRLEAADAVPLLLSLVDALGHCHSEGVIHRDLKPENLLLDDEVGTLHLLDFGLAATEAAVVDAQRAKLSDTLASRGLDGGGTFEYMAPERRRGEAGGVQSDVYALGVILFEALSGQLPRGLTRLRELCAAPRGVEAICEHMLRPDPSSRPTLAEVALALGKERPKHPWAGIKSRRQAAAGPKEPLVEYVVAGVLALSGFFASGLVHGRPEAAVAGLLAGGIVLAIRRKAPPRHGELGLAPKVGGVLWLAMALVVGLQVGRGRPIALSKPGATPSATPGETPTPRLPTFSSDDLSLGTEALQTRIEAANAACQAYSPDGFRQELEHRVAEHHLLLLEELLKRRRSADEAAYAAAAAGAASEASPEAPPQLRLKGRQNEAREYRRALALDPVHPDATGWLCSQAIGSYIELALASKLEVGPGLVQDHYSAGRLAEGDRLWHELQYVLPRLAGLDQALAARPRPLPEEFASQGRLAYERALELGDDRGAQAVLERQIPFPVPGGGPAWWEDRVPPREAISLFQSGAWTRFPPVSSRQVLSAQQANTRERGRSLERRDLRLRLRRSIWHLDVLSEALPYAESVADQDRSGLRELAAGAKALAGAEVALGGLPEHFRLAYRNLRDARQRRLREELSWSQRHTRGRMTEPAGNNRPPFKLAEIFPAAQRMVGAERRVVWREIELRWAVEGASPEPR